MQIGTVWLPLPHVDASVGWQGFSVADRARRVDPAGACFVAAGVFFFLAVRRAFNDGAAAAVACMMLALNPNLLYLQSIPMTEAVFLACLTALLYFTVRFRETQGWGAMAGAAVAAAAGSLTRYEGWFVIPFAALFFLIAATAAGAWSSRWSSAHRLARTALLARAQPLLFRQPSRIL